MASLALIGYMVTVAYLVGSGAAKIAHPGRARAALVTLGLEPRWARVCIRLLIVAEFAVACAVALMPHRAVTQASLISLFGVFAIAGASALSRGIDVDCGCSGALRSSSLGWSQIGQLIIAAGIAFGLRFLPRHNLEQRTVLLSTAVLLAATGVLVAAAPVFRRVRGARRSFAEAREAARRLGWVAPSPIIETERIP